MTAPATTPRAEMIAEDLLADTRAFLQAEGRELHSWQVEALARAVARHLADLEIGIGEREVLPAGISAASAPATRWTPAGFVREEHIPCEGEPLPTPLRDAALGLEAKPETPVPPRMLIVQRWDRSEPESVPEGEVRWGLRALRGEDGRDSPLFAWLLCQREEKAGRVPYIRPSPDSPWGVRVEILGEGR